MRCSGKVVIVTGGAMGIGRSIAEGFLAEGAKVVIADRDGAEEAAGQLDADQGRVVGVACDVASRGDTEAMARAAVDAFGQIDVLVNNAGIYSSLKPMPFEDLDIDEWKRVLDVNVMGLAWRHAPSRRRCARRAPGASSTFPRARVQGCPLHAALRGSKGAVNAMTKALAKELGGAGILVNGVAPGFTMSDGVLANPDQLEKLQDISLKARVIQRDQHPADIVGAAIYFASQDAAFVTGQTLVVDGGAYFLRA